jgi:hypothetical protein
MVTLSITKRIINHKYNKTQCLVDTFLVIPRFKSHQDQPMGAPGSFPAPCFALPSQQETGCLVVLLLTSVPEAVSGRTPLHNTRTTIVSSVRHV